MQNLKFILIGCLLFSMLSSCTREFTPDLEEIENKMVVNSFISNEETINVSVTKSLTPGDNFDLEELVNAKVSIYENDLLLGDLEYEKNDGDPIGYFKSNNIQAMPNKTYEVFVENEGYDDASAIAEIPQGADISDATVSFIGTNSYNYYFSINNTPEPNFYYFKLFFRAYIMDEDMGERVYVKPEIIEVPEGAIPSGQRYLDNGYVFTDESLKEGENIFTGIAKSGISPDFFDDKPEGIQLDTSQLFIHLETLSEDAYKFYYSHAISLISDTDFFSEAAPIYTNVEGGLGIFAGVYVSEVGVEVE